MTTDKTIDVLNTLITINNDRIEGYETASKETEDIELKSLFSRFISTSQNARRDLVHQVEKLGGEEAEGTKISGKFFRVWMDVKSALTGNDREAILGSCEFGEDKALETYNDAIENDAQYLSDQQRNMITEQKHLLKSDRDHIIALKNAL